MKKLIIIFALIVFAITTTHAQKFLVGGGLVYGTQVDKGGLDIRADVRLNQKWGIIPYFNFFFPNNGTNYKNGWNSFNIDGHYIHALSSEAHIYPLFGLNFSTIYSKYKPDNVKNSNTELGINLGGGIDYFFSSKVAGFFEVKYVIGDYDQGVLGFGVLYRLN